MPLSYSFHSVYSSKSILSSWNTQLLNLSFISCSFTLSYSNILRYLYSSSSISLNFSPPGNSIPTNPVILFSLCHSFHSFKSSINRRWFFSPPPKVYLVLALHSTWVSSILHITSDKGNKLSSWKIPLLMLTFAKLSPQEVNSVCLPLIFLQIWGCCTSSRLSSD